MNCDTFEVRRAEAATWSDDDKEHAKGCATCSRHARVAQAMVSVMRTMPTPPLPPDFARRVMQKAEAEAPPTWIRLLSDAACQARLMRRLWSNPIWMRYTCHWTKPDSRHARPVGLALVGIMAASVAAFQSVPTEWRWLLPVALMAIMALWGGLQAGLRTWRALRQEVQSGMVESLKVAPMGLRDLLLGHAAVGLFPTLLELFDGILLLALLVFAGAVKLAYIGWILQWVAVLSVSGLLIGGTVAFVKLPTRRKARARKTTSFRPAFLRHPYAVLIWRIELRKWRYEAMAQMAPYVLLLLPGQIWGWQQVLPWAMLGFLFWGFSSAFRVLDEAQHEAAMSTLLCSPLTPSRMFVGQWMTAFHKMLGPWGIFCTVAVLQSPAAPLSVAAVGGLCLLLGALGAVTGLLNRYRLLVENLPPVFSSLVSR